MTTKDLDNLKAIVVFLSHPCQPFTRQGSKRDNQDRRTEYFFSFNAQPQGDAQSSTLHADGECDGFSNTRGEFVGVLNSLDYVVQKFLLSLT